MKKLLPTISLTLLLLVTPAFAGDTADMGFNDGECDHSSVVEFVCDLFGMGCS